jgi:DNA polymerase III subunit delta'
MSDTLETLLNIEQRGLLEGSWLVTGSLSGEEKALQIKKFIARMMKTDDINAYFSNVKWIERPLTEQAQKELVNSIVSGKPLDKETEKKQEKKSDITVDSIREIGKFCSMTFDKDVYRFLIINTADDLNENAQNALLKILEEPPSRTVFLLISNNMGKLLPTISSRCRVLRFSSMNRKEMEDSLKNSLPEGTDIPLLMRLGEYDFSKCLDIYKNNGIAVYEQLQSFFSKKPSGEQIFNFAQQVTSSDEAFDRFCLLFSEVLIEKSKTSFAYFSLLEDFTSNLPSIKNLYLDKKQFIANLLLKMNEI